MLISYLPRQEMRSLQVKKILIPIGCLIIIPCIILIHIVYREYAIKQNLEEHFKNADFSSLQKEVKNLSNASKVSLNEVSSTMSPNSIYDEGTDNEVVTEYVQMPSGTYAEIVVTSENSIINLKYATSYDAELNYIQDCESIVQYCMEDIADNITFVGNINGSMFAMMTVLYNGYTDYTIYLTCFSNNKDLYGSQYKDSDILYRYDLNKISDDDKLNKLSEQFGIKN